VSAKTWSATGPPDVPAKAAIDLAARGLRDAHVL